MSHVSLLSFACLFRERMSCLPLGLLANILFCNDIRLIMHSLLRDFIVVWLGCVLWVWCVVLYVGVCVVLSCVGVCVCCVAWVGCGLRVVCVVLCVWCVCVCCVALCCVCWTFYVWKNKEQWRPAARPTADIIGLYSKPYDHWHYDSVLKQKIKLGSIFLVAGLVQNTLQRCVWGAHYSPNLITIAQEADNRQSWQYSP